MGCITARGDWTLNDAPKSAHVETNAQHSTTDFLIAGFKLEDYLQSQKTYLDRCSALALAGCALALGDAGVQWPAAEADDFGITLGTHLGCIETMKAFWDKTTGSGVRGASPLLFSHSYFNSPISLCAIEFGLKGYHATFCAGQDSGLEAVRAARDAIRLGHARAMLCGGVEALCPARAQLEPAPKLGEAAVFFVLESAARATRRCAEHPRAFDIRVLESAATRHNEVRDRFGDCGGAQSALAVALCVADLE